MMMRKEKITLKVSADDDQVAYIYLPKHPKKLIPGIVKKTISMYEIMSDYKGIPLYFDFDEAGELIGIEIVG
jgi:hypothetical protein